MALSLASYITVIRETLEASLNLRHFPSQRVEKQTHPEIELQENKELLLQPLLIARSEHEKCLVESSINSVRVSFCIKKTFEIEQLLTKLFERYLALRAEKFYILRKKPISGYDFSFLIMYDHLEDMKKEEIINFIIEFIQGVDKEINDMKLAINTQCRIAASFFTHNIANN